MPLLMLDPFKVVRPLPSPDIVPVTVKPPVTVTKVAPTFWEIIESPMFWPAVKSGMVLVVPLPVTPLPAPAQLPVDRHIVPVASGRV